MSERCERCGRAFGGAAALNRAHVGGRCRPDANLLRLGWYRDAEGVWHRPGPRTPGQLRLPLFGRGRPQRCPGVFFYRSLGGVWWRARVVGRKLVCERQEGS